MPGLIPLFGEQLRPLGLAAGSAAFKHFKVSVRQVKQGSPGVHVLAEVCVRALPPDPQGDKTRISWDPWTIWTGFKSVGAGRRPRRYRVRSRWTALPSWPVHIRLDLAALPLCCAAGEVEEECDL